ncbi:hypothetical protein [Streptomyces sp. TLI_146]|uniref:hypothetical protein n=1 Tax=Streptomyces sp. TLI_146 TaxID=1938858 RepID=UPI000CB62C5F|nr:hypothetical protein [Streptomyces sp. TLI_146]PKV90013.1 hypothetical protein BX283_7670 [Streptomyces sp. TLI_146]
MTGRRPVVLSSAEAAPAATPPTSAGPYGIDTDALEQSLIDALTPDARLPAAALAARTGHPESTACRRLAQLAVGPPRSMSGAARAVAR